MRSYLFPLVVIALCACSGSKTSDLFGPPQSNANAGDASVRGEGGIGAPFPASDAGLPGESAQCTSQAQLGRVVRATASPDAAPARTGGAIADGTYVLTQMTLYGAGEAPALTAQMTMAKRAGTVQSVASVNAVEQRSVSTIRLSDRSLTISDTCVFPKSDAGSAPQETEYTASAKELKLYLLLEGGFVFEETFAKQ